LKQFCIISCVSVLFFFGLTLIPVTLASADERAAFTGCEEMPTQPDNYKSLKRQKNCFRDVAKRLGAKRSARREFRACQKIKPNRVSTQKMQQKIDCFMDVASSLMPDMAEPPAAPFNDASLSAAPSPEQVPVAPRGPHRTNIKACESACEVSDETCSACERIVALPHGPDRRKEWRVHQRLVDCMSRCEGGSCIARGYENFVCEAAPVAAPSTTQEPDSQNGTSRVQTVAEICQQPCERSAPGWPQSCTSCEALVAEWGGPEEYGRRVDAMYKGKETEGTSSAAPTSCAGQYAAGSGERLACQKANHDLFTGTVDASCAEQYASGTAERNACLKAFLDDFNRKSGR